MKYYFILWNHWDTRGLFIDKNVSPVCPRLQSPPLRLLLVHSTNTRVRLVRKICPSAVLTWKPGSVRGKKRCVGILETFGSKCNKTPSLVSSRRGHTCGYAGTLPLSHRSNVSSVSIFVNTTWETPPLNYTGSILIELNNSLNLALLQSTFVILVDVQLFRETRTSACACVVDLKRHTSFSVLHNANRSGALPPNRNHNSQLCGHICMQNLSVPILSCSLSWNCCSRTHLTYNKSFLNKRWVIKVLNLYKKCYNKYLKCFVEARQTIRNALISYPSLFMSFQPRL